MEESAYGCETPCCELLEGLLQRAANSADHLQRAPSVLPTLLNMEESGLLLLPDDALLAVLAHVAPRQLLNLRVLCRRLRDICLHPDLWRSVYLEERLVLAALRLVPCLGGASIRSNLLRRRVASEISTCTCVVAHLDLLVGKKADLVPATAIAERVAALGGMTKLSLSIRYEVPLQPLPALLKMLFKTQQLRELELEFTWPSLMAPWRDFKGTAFLKSLSFLGETCHAQLLESLVRTHAATLENVQLHFCRLPSSLKDLAKLQSLTFCLEDLDENKIDLSVLAGITDLETLHIRNSFYVTRFPPEVLDLFQRSSRLQSVTMPLLKENPTAPLLALLASPAARGLQTLVFSNIDDIRKHSRQKVPEAVAALTLFPSLQVLDLGLVSSGFFKRVVSSTLAPSLRTLRVRDWEHCAHHSLHDVNVQNLLARNPQLHFWPGSIHFKVCHCQWCKSGCHKELKRFKFGEGPALASHAKRIGCPANCFQLKC